MKTIILFTSLLAFLASATAQTGTVTANISATADTEIRGELDGSQGSAPVLTASGLSEVLFYFSLQNLPPDFVLGYAEIFVTLTTQAALNQLTGLNSQIFIPPSWDENSHGEDVNLEDEQLLTLDITRVGNQVKYSGSLLDTVIRLQLSDDLDNTGFSLHAATGPAVSIFSLNAPGTQGPLLHLVGTGTIPEPACAFILVVGTGTLLGRRRQRQLA